MFEKYPDIVSVNDVCNMTTLCKTSVYNLLRKGEIAHVRVGTKYIIPRDKVVDWITVKCGTIETVTNSKLQNNVTERGC